MAYIHVRADREPRRNNMSLDVYLTIPDAPPEQRPHTAIYIREHGSTIEISRAEWDKRNPGVEPVSALTESDFVYKANITHNLSKMAKAAGIYEHLWRPEEIGMTKAAYLIVPLAEGLTLLKGDPVYFRTFNPSNGWGDYDGLVAFVANYLKACIDNYDAFVSVSR